MIIKLRIESSKEEIRNFTDKLSKDDTLTINSISEVYPNSRGVSIYDRCFVEIEMKKEKLESRGNGIWQK